MCVVWEVNAKVYINILPAESMQSIPETVDSGNDLLGLLVGQCLGHERGHGLEKVFPCFVRVHCFEFAFLRRVRRGGDVTEWTGMDWNGETSWQSTTVQEGGHT